LHLVGLAFYLLNAPSFVQNVTLFNTPARIGARRRHLQGVPSQLLNSQHVKWLQTTVRPHVAEMLSGFDECVLIPQRSAYHMYIQEETNYGLIAVNDGYQSLLSCVRSLMLKYIKMKT
jgi:hypothetical protein